MKQDKVLQVCYEDQTVGTLAMTADHKVAFQYSDEWLETGFSINPFSLPLQKQVFATVYKGNIIKNLIMDCQSYTKYRPNETTGGIFVSWRRKEELPTGA
jgi:HipA-like protein